jgi:hypothetical protein
VRLLGESGRIICTRHNSVREAPQYQQSMHGAGCVVSEPKPETRNPKLNLRPETLN